MSPRSSSDGPSLLRGRTEPAGDAEDHGAPPGPTPLSFRATPTRHLIDVTPGSLQDRILAATLRCLGRWGTVKTTLDDVAREAGCSRATVYRVFPDGRDALFEAAGVRELFRVLHELAEVATAAPTLADQLASLLHTALTAIQQHEVLQYLCKHEPGKILPYVTFDGIDPMLDIAETVLGPFLERFVDPPTASTTAEWLARIVISYGFDPQPGDADLTDPATALRFVESFILPGLTDGLLPGAPHPTDPHDAKE
jgi:AcrR family transcriptional regulator